MKQRNHRVNALSPLLLAFACVAESPRAWCEAIVGAETLAQAVQIRGPAGTPLISSRRVTQFVSVAIVERPWGRRGAVFTFRARVRIDADFGESCDPTSGRCFDEVNRSRLSEFVPLFARRSFDVPYAYADLSGIARGVMDVRVGRIFQSDALGFALFDGARARLAPGIGVVLELAGGLQTRGGLPLSTGRFEPDGVIRLDRTAWTSALLPYVAPSVVAPMVAFALETSDPGPVTARIAYRRVWTDRGVADERIGAGVDATVGVLRARAEAAYVPAVREVSQARIDAALRFGAGRYVGLEFARTRPVFDFTSIWMAFWMDGTDDMRAYAEIDMSGRTALSGAAYVRRYALGDSGPSNRGIDQGDLWNAGGAASVRYRAPAWQAHVRARGEAGAVGARVGVDGDAWWWMIPDVLRVDARLSLWAIRDELRPDRGGLSFGVVLGATARLGSLADVHLDIEDDVNPIVGQRFRATAALNLRAPL